MPDKTFRRDFKMGALLTECNAVPKRSAAVQYLLRRRSAFLFKNQTSFAHIFKL